MDTWVIVALAIGALFLLGVVLWTIRRAREQRRLDERRDEAAELREKAELQARRAAEREQAASEELRRAERERHAAAVHSERADEVDPDLDWHEPPRSG